MTMPDLDLDAIEARAAAATDGPWLPPIGSGDVGYVWRSDDGHFQVAIACDGNEEANAVFIAHARTDIPALVAEVRRLRQVMSEAHRALQYDADGAPSIVAALHWLEPHNYDQDPQA
jgi:hypothetical protein